MMIDKRLYKYALETALDTPMTEWEYVWKNNSWRIDDLIISDELIYDIISKLHREREYYWIKNNFGYATLQDLPPLA